MKKRIGTMFLMVVMAIAISGQAFAALPNTKSPEEQAVIKAQLRDVIAGQMSFVNSITGALNESDLVKDLLKDVISGLLSNTDGLLDLTGPVLAGLIEDALREALGDAYPDSVDIGTVINDVLGNDAINNLIVEILENKYFGMFIDKTIDNIFAELDLTPFVGVIVDAIIDNVTEQIWNNGNPTTTLIVGHWNNSAEKWNEFGVGTYLTVTTLVSIYNAIRNEDLNAIVGSDGIDLNDLLAAFDINLVLNAAKDALDDVVAEFRADFRAKIRTRIEARVEEFKANAKAKLVDELNSLLAKHELEVVLNTDMSLSEIENAIKGAIDEMKAEKREEKKAEIEAKLAKLKTSLFALSKDIRDCIDRIIQCIKDKKDDGDDDPVIEIVKVEATAFVTKLNGNKNNLTITVTEYYSDGTFYEIIKTFSIDNNAAGSYVVSDDDVSYTVYVNTKGNTQIREIYIVE